VSSGPGASVGAGAAGDIPGAGGPSTSVSRSKCEEVRSGGGDSAGCCDDAGCSGGDGGASGDGDAGGGAGCIGSGDGVGWSADASGFDRGVTTGATIGGGGSGGNFIGFEFGSKGGGSVGVLTWSRIEDDSSGIDDDSPGLGASSNDEISFVVGDGGGSANALLATSPTLGPATIPATSAANDPSLRMCEPFNCFVRMSPLRLSPKR